MSFPSDAPEYCPPELRRWVQLDADGSKRIPGSEAAQFLEWKHTAFLKTWEEIIPHWKFSESNSYSESLLLQLKVRRLEADRKRQAAQAKNRRKKNRASEKSKTLAGLSQFEGDSRHK